MFSKLHRQLFAICFLIFVFSPLVAQETRAMWAPVWDIDTPQKIDRLVADAVRAHFQVIIAEVRYRGDALYTPDANDPRHPNPEPRSLLLTGNNFDPLSYILRKAHAQGLEVHAWMTMFVASPKDTSRLPKNHPYFRHPEWVTRDQNGTLAKDVASEGAYWDPALPEVQDYLSNIVLYVAEKYHPDGIHLDYIRYAGQNYGYAHDAVERWQADGSPDWNNWRCEQIDRFMARCYAEVKAIDPEMELSASVKPNPDDAIAQYAQDWPEWLKRGIVDTVYPMAYFTLTSTLQNTLSETVYSRYSDRIVCGLRAWKEKRPYPFTELKDKIGVVRGKHLGGMAMFGYSGMIESGFLNQLQKTAFARACQRTPMPAASALLFGYVRDKQGAPVCAGTVEFVGHNVKTDANGFWWLKADQGTTGSLTVNYEGKAQTQNGVRLTPGVHRYDFNF